MGHYPIELRERVVRAAEQGELTIAKIARLFNVGTTFVKKMLNLHRNNEGLEPRLGGRGPKPLLQKKELALLREEVKKRPDVTLEELQAMLADQYQVRVSVPTIFRALKELNLPRKKKVRSPMNVTKKNAASSGK